jgi:hypothetical protein
MVHTKEMSCKESFDWLTGRRRVVVVPAIGVLSLARAPRGFQKAVFMNSVSHGKVWTKNTASSF